MMHTQSRKRKWATHSEDPNSGASSSSTLPHGGDFEGGGKQRDGNNYEVFLSFRGQDTRKGFTDCLYTSLDDAGIHVFRDDNELPVGEEIGPELFRSITQSKISIPIISEDYASSKWCLRELTLILKCKRERGQTVLPIFYKVEPGQVRHLAGKFGDAIDEHKKNLDETVQEWKKALEEVTSLKGWESEKTDHGHEGKFIKTVVRKVMSELNKQFLKNVPEQLVGIDDHVENIMSFIDAKCSDSRMIGIYGMGGIGKTTLAKVLYNKLSSRYEYRSFVADIRETCKLKRIEGVQKQLISDINGDLCDVSNVDEGIGILKSRFTSKKVLVILDDVDDHTHLDDLVGDGSWFKAGSIVILTTRDKGILHKPGVSCMYELNELPSDQSLVLFSRHAFRMDSPSTNYEVISRDIVSTTGGLPLALKVIGSFLCGKTIEAWKATSKKLEKVPDEKVQEKLRISYDTLDREDKQMFLDIACFFIGSSKQYATYMWDACGFYPGKGIEVLSLLSLIKIDEDGNLWMHDQLRDMGREIVRLENEKKLGKRSRLWNSDEAVEVLGSNKGTSKIEALRLDNWRIIDDCAEDDWAEDHWAEDDCAEDDCAEDHWAEQLKELTNYSAEKFKELTNLRFLDVRGANFTGDFQNLLPQLRWLHWNFYSLDFEATNFHPKKLVVLDLSQTEISEDWGGWDPLKMATELKVLNLSHCQSLTTTPDLSTFKRLEILILEGCERLKEIHPSLGVIKTLVSLNVMGCSQLKELPEWISSQNKLETLDACVCRQLARIPSSIDHLPSLSLLNLSFCAELAQLPDSLGSLTSLQRLLLSCCSSLREIPDSIGKLASLTELDLSFTAIVELPDSIWNMQNLSILDISGTLFETRLFESDVIRILPIIQKLRASGCKNLEGLPGELVLLNAVPSLQNVSIRCSRELPSCLLARVLSQRASTPPTNNLAMDHQTANSEHVLNRSKPFGISDEVNNLLVNNLHVTLNSQSHGQSSNSSNNLPKNVVMTLNQGSPVKSMDFHPVQQILLLVGTDMGDVIVWEVGSRARIAVRNFEVWDRGTCSKALQASLANDNKASVNRVRWSPDGILFGVAYSKHIVHIYLYLGGDDIREHLEIEAHVGSVNDLAFSYPKKQLCVVTCGEDRSIKVWDAVTGAKQHSLEGHEAPVYSICPHVKEKNQFIFSTSADGTVKGWLYDSMGCRLDVPSHSSTMVAYCADGTRLFSCGTNKEGESYLLEGNEREGTVKRMYHGLGKRSGGIMQFDTTKNRFLAAGDEFMVKFWDMDNNNILTSTAAEGGLPASPCIRFNKEGDLLAVSTSDSSIKILANADGIGLLRTREDRPIDAF